MANPKKDKSAPKASPKPKVKELSKKDCKDIRGGLSSFVSGGLAGPEDFNFQQP
jgi:hypothetical protein